MLYVGSGDCESYLYFGVWVVGCWIGLYWWVVGVVGYWEGVSCCLCYYVEVFVVGVGIVVIEVFDVGV